VIRLARADDAAACAAIYRPAVADSWISFEEIAPDAAAMRERIATVGAAYPWLVYEDETVLGFAYASKHRERAAYRWSVDVSVHVQSGVRRRGVGRTLYTALFRILEQQGFHRAYAGIALPNDASIGLHRAVGFTYLGVYTEVGFKNGAWGDVTWWQRPIGAPGLTPAGPPSEPIPLPQLDVTALTEALSI
jgi:L-amino acid N-acyltransferase YncA